MAEMIICPNCKTEIEVSQALAERLGARLRQEFEAETRRRDEELRQREAAVRALAGQLDERDSGLKAREAAIDDRIKEEAGKAAAEARREATKQAERDAAAAVQTLNEELDSLRGKLAEASKAEAEIRKQRRELEEREAALPLQLERQLEAERQKIREAARQQALEEAKRLAKRDDEEVERLRVEVEQQRTALEDARKAKLEVARKEALLKQREQDLELRVLDEVSKMQEAIRADARRQADEAHRLREAEKEKKISDLVGQIEELKRRAEQGSQQLQGEVLELALEDLLRQAFRFDSIEPVPKGVQGADVIQRVHDQTGAECGLILWESKRTKNWSDAWLAKLRDDLRAAKADQAILITQALPKGCDSFTFVDGVWVTSWACAVGLAGALRLGLTEVGKAKRALVGQQGKMELLFAYLTGAEFRNRITGVVEAFIGLRADLDEEKRAMQRVWAKREKQLERALASSSGLYGDLQGIIGKSLPGIETLELPPTTQGSHGDEPAAPTVDDHNAEPALVVSGESVWLEKIVAYLRQHPGPRGRREMVEAVGMGERAWSAVAAMLSNDPRIERTGVGRGTRYSFRA